MQLLYGSALDQFELCLSRCRPSALGVQHENKYRDPVAKFCFGDEPPNLVPTGVK